MDSARSPTERMPISWRPVSPIRQAKARGVGDLKVPGLVAVAQHPQQYSTPGVGVQVTVGIKLYVADAGDPAPAVGVVRSGAGPVRHIPETGKPAVSVRLFLAAGQTNQQHGG